MKNVYLDYSATTPIDPRVLAAMMPLFAETFGNASSVHAFGREARSILETSRERVARCIGAKADELFFTSGGTESDNYALKGVAVAARKKGKNHIIISAIEHHAVLEAMIHLEKKEDTNSSIEDAPIIVYYVAKIDELKNVTINTKNTK